MCCDYFLCDLLRSHSYNSNSKYKVLYNIQREKSKSSLSKD